MTPVDRPTGDDGDHAAPGLAPSRHHRRQERPVTSVLVVCASITESYATRFCTAVQQATEAGADLRGVLIANSTATQALSGRWPGLVVHGPNAGFAASINQAAAGGDFRWLVIANDDMDFDAGTFVALARHLAGEPADEHRMIRLTQELPWRRIPGLGSVFTNLSLLEKFPLGLDRRMDTEASAPSDTRLYPPFSLVAISGSLWREASGLEESLPFCYEDAWFARLAHGSATGVAFGTHDLGVRHLSSASTTSHIDVVLPVITWSALVYLQLIGVPSLLARATCLLALLVRTPLSLGATANRRKHLRGIWRAARAVVTQRAPTLAAPDSIGRHTTSTGEGEPRC